jgi:hypothetical protein
VFVAYTWRPGVFERSSSKQSGFKNPGYYAFKDKEQAEREASIHAYGWPFAFGSVAMWGEVIEHERGWRSEYAAVRSIVKITGDIPFLRENWLLLELREKYRCTVVTELWATIGWHGWMKAAGALIGLPRVLRHNMPPDIGEFRA